MSGRPATLTGTPEDRECSNCGCLQSTVLRMKQCSRCKSVLYCSRDCQKADWKAHKKTCLKTVQAISSGTAPAMNTSNLPPSTVRPRALSAPTLSPPSAPRAFPRATIAPGLDVNLTTPFTRLSAKRWLHGRTDKDIYKILYDTIRIRSWDDKSLAAKSLMDLVQGSKPHASGMLAFRFIKTAARKSYLPPSWTTQKERECLLFGPSEENWKASERPVRLQQIIARYGTPSIVSQMRIFAEQVYGPVPGKASFMPILRMRMLAEREELIRNLMKAK